MKMRETQVLRPSVILHSDWKLIDEGYLTLTKNWILPY